MNTRTKPGTALRALLTTAAAAVFAFTLAPAPSSFAQQALSLSRHAGRRFVEGELIVKYAPSVTSRDRNLSLSNHQGRLITSLGDPTLVHVKLKAGRKVADSLDEYNADQNVEYAQPNYLYHATATAPNTVGLAQEWGIKNNAQTISAANITGLGIPAPAVQGYGNGLYATNNPPGGVSGYDIDAEDAWSINSDCSDSIVAVVDSGVNYNHSDLAANMWVGPTDGSANCQDGLPPIHGCDFVSGTNTPLDQFGHGTHVAGIIASAGSATVSHGTTGVCWTAQIMAIRVLDTTGFGSDAQILNGLNYAIAHGAKVINMSLGGEGYDPAFNSAIFNGSNSGVLFVVAAGNNSSDNDSTSFSPCSNVSPNLICVAALDQGSALASFSNFGKQQVHVGAPGTNILSTFPGVKTTTTDTLAGATCAGGDGWTCGQAAGTTGLGWGADGEAFYDPPLFGMEFYVAGSNDYVWKTYSTLSSSTGTVTTFYLDSEAYLLTGDSFTAYATSAAGDPVPADPATVGGTAVLNIAGDSSNTDQGGPLTLDVSSYVVGSPQISVGFQMQSAVGSSGSFGVGVGFFAFDQLVPDSLAPFHYTIDNGTSMATPYVAGLATMLYSYNTARGGPFYSYADARNEILTGGVPIAALQTTTITGKAINMVNALTTIAAPVSMFASQP